MGSGIRFSGDKNDCARKRDDEIRPLTEETLALLFGGVTRLGRPVEAVDDGASLAEPLVDDAGDMAGGLRARPPVTAGRMPRSSAVSRATAAPRDTAAGERATSGVLDLRALAGAYEKDRGRLARGSTPPPVAVAGADLLRPTVQPRRDARMWGAVAVAAVLAVACAVAGVALWHLRRGGSDGARMARRPADTAAPSRAATAAPSRAATAAPSRAAAPSRTPRSAADRAGDPVAPVGTVRVPGQAGRETTAAGPAIATTARAAATTESATRRARAGAGRDPVDVATAREAVAAGADATAAAARPAGDGAAAAAGEAAGEGDRAEVALPDEGAGADDPPPEDVLAALRAERAAAEAARRADLLPETPAPAPAEPACDPVTCLIDPTGACCPPARRSRPAGPRAGAPRPVTLSRRDINAAFSRVRGRVESCGDRHGFSGVATIRVKVAPDGTVASATVDKGTQAFRACVIERAAALRFPETRDGGSVAYPFVFR